MNRFFGATRWNENGTSTAEIRRKLNYVTFYSTSRYKEFEMKKSHDALHFFFSLKCSAALIDTSLKALCLIQFSNSLSHTCTHSSVKDMIWYNPPVEKKNGQKHVLHQIIL